MATRQSGLILLVMTVQGLILEVTGLLQTAKNGKYMLRVSKAGYEKFNAAWSEKIKQNNRSKGFFYYDSIGVLIVWGK